MTTGTAGNTVTFRLLDFHKEGRQALYDLFVAVYSDLDPLSKRWNWQYLNHPRSREIQILVAESNGRIIGCTSHFPMDILLDGERHTCFHGSGSMIHPDYRRLGIMSQIVRKRAGMLPIYYGRGVAPNMFELLLKSGYRKLEPSNYMVCVLSPVKWLLRKIKLNRDIGTLTAPVSQSDSEYRVVDRFDQEFDEFWERVAPKYPGIVIKDSDFMNWRYVDQPDRYYQIIYRRKENRLASVMVIRSAEHVVHIVDLIWDQDVPEEPDATVAFLKRHVKSCGFTNLYCWGTLQQLRDVLKNNGFVGLKEMHLCGVHARERLIDRAADVSRIHFVDGDGDYEFLE